MTGSRFSPIALLALLGAILWFAPSAALAQGREITQSSGSVEIARHQGRLIRLSSPAASVFIANPEIADVSVKSARMVYIFGKAPGTTTLFAVDRNETVIADIDIVVSHDLMGLEKAIGTLLPAGGVTAESVHGGIVLNGSVETATDSENLRRLALRFLSENEEIINRVKVTQPNQVNVRVRLAEVSRTAIKLLGFNFDIFDGKFRFTSGNSFLGSPRALNDLGFFDAFESGFRPPSPALATPPVVSDPGFILNPSALFGFDASASGTASLLGGNIGGATVSSFFDALEEYGLVKTLAEPNLTAISGETASFLAGGEFPIPVAQLDGIITIEFKEFGVSLAFTPTVLSANRISMRVRPEVSELSEVGAVTIGGFTIPALTTRRAETTIELGSGQSFAIAGLLQEDFQDTVRQIPYLGDIPLLGELFKSEAFRKNESELIILVTPYIVKPLDNPDIPLPTDSLTKAKIALKNERTRKPSASLSRTVQVPLGSAGGEQLGAATYLLD